MHTRLCHLTAGESFLCLQAHAACTCTACKHHAYRLHTHRIKREHHFLRVFQVDRSFCLANAPSAAPPPMHAPPRQESEGSEFVFVTFCLLLFVGHFSQSRLSLISACIDCSGTKVLSCTDDRLAIVFSCISGDEMLVLSGHTKTLRSAVFSRCLRSTALNIFAPCVFDIV